MKVSKPDIEEIAPDRFLVRDFRATPILKGEGTLRGRVFELGTWRRAGLLARLRAASLMVSTIEDQIARLPPLPPPEQGAVGWRSLATPVERYSRFDSQSLTWQPIEPSQRDGVSGVAAEHGEPLRRRKGRGPGDYYLAMVDRHGGLGLRIVDMTSALLMGFARASRARRPTLRCRRDGAYLILPVIELPAPHQAVLERIMENTHPPRFHERVRDLAATLFERLGVELTGDE